MRDPSKTPTRTRPRFLSWFKAYCKKHGISPYSDNEEESGQYAFDIEPHVYAAYLAGLAAGRAYKEVPPQP